MAMRFLIGYVAALLGSASAFAQSNALTIPELVRRQAPEPLYQSRTRELMPPALDDVIPKADLVIRGTIESSTTYLSQDQRSLYTEYIVYPRRVISQTKVQSSERPGAASPITVKRWGGRTTVDGVQVIAEDADLRQFAIGEELLLVLVRSGDEGKYELLGLGAFVVSKQTIRPLVKHPHHQRFEGWTSTQFESEIHRMRP